MKINCLAKSIFIQKYKCFDSLCGFSELKTSNILIGRNNIGKSALVETIQYLNTNSFPDKLIYQITLDLTEEVIRSYFTEDVNHSDLHYGPGGNDWNNAGKYLVGSEITLRIQNAWAPSLVKYDESHQHIFDSSCGTNLINSFPNPFSDIFVRRVSAERDIIPEKANYNELTINENGVGVTNFIQNIINNSRYDSNLIKKELLSAFNKIMEPDFFIKDIITQIDQGNMWEVYFIDHDDNTIALSRSGSGLKTILLALVNILIYPKIRNQNYSNCLFIFEELENNLHPALQRRLLTYIHDFVTKNEAIAFYTTHSNIAIDLFSTYTNATITLIKKEDDVIVTEPTHSFADKKSILNELDIRASDLLQTNTLIWVEGPSDRVYLNKWIEIFRPNEIQEGVHYQFIYYGGKLLSHYSAAEDDVENLLNIIRINTNSIIIIDSDKTSKQAHVNETKKRIIEEFNRMQLFSWITKGREIENYIATIVLSLYLSKTNIPTFDQYEDISKYLDNIEPYLGKKFERNKVHFAEKVIKYMTKENTENQFDISEMTNNMVKLIKIYNKMQDS